MARHYPRPLHATLTAAVLCLLGASQSLADDDDFCKEFKRGYVTGLHFLHTNDFPPPCPPQPQPPASDWGYTELPI